MVPSLAFVTLLSSVSDTFFPLSFNVNFQSVLFVVPILLLSDVREEDLLTTLSDVRMTFEEMMLGLESWIPMYMTGQISPYYLKSNPGNVFHHFLKVSGAAVLSGEAISGHHSEGRYYLSKTKEDITYYNKRAEALLL